MAKLVEVNVTKPIAPQTRRGAKTRASLVRAAKEIFERDGFLDARITDISKRAGLSHGAYYHYFTSKEQLFREVAEIEEPHLIAPHEDPSVDPALAADALGAMVGRFAELWLVQGYQAYDFDHAVEQLTRIWANALQVKASQKALAQ